MRGWSMALAASALVLGACQREGREGVNEEKWFEGDGRAERVGDVEAAPVVGTVERFDEERVTLRSADGREQEFELGESVDATGLREGDEVRASFTEEGGTRRVTRIERMDRMGGDDEPELVRPHGAGGERESE